MEKSVIEGLCKKNGVEIKGKKLSDLLIELKDLGVLVVKRGRPVDPSSERQKRLKELEKKRKNGTLKRGRPINKNSERQKRLKDLEEKRKKGELKRGRPIDPNSKRQKDLKLKLEKLEVKKNK